jgi:hypothetical protein
MPKPLKFPTKVLIGFDDRQLGEIDEWRRKQPDLPTRSAAVRRLVDLGLAAKAKPHQKRQR